MSTAWPTLPTGRPSCASAVANSSASSPRRRTAPSAELVDALAVTARHLELRCRHRQARCHARRARAASRVGYTPDVLNDCVADLAFALHARRGTRQCRRPTASCAAASGRQERFPLGTRASGKRLGILGLGRIGRTIAQRASGFDMEVGYTNRQPAADVPYAFKSTPLELAQWADFLVVAVAGGASTRHVISREVLDALGPNGFLVNVSRGTAIDEAALVARAR